MCHRYRLALWCIFLSTSISLAQPHTTSTLLEYLSSEYQVEFAIDPNLEPSLDSLQNLHSISSLDDLLQQLLKTDALSYRIIDENKILIRREVFFPGQYVLSGRVLDESGNSLPYAAITDSKSSHGTYTDEHGAFTLTLQDTSGTIQVHYLGYKMESYGAHQFMQGDGTVRLTVDEVPLKQVLIIVMEKPISYSPNGDALKLDGFNVYTAEQLFPFEAADLIRRLNGYTAYSSEEGIRLRSTDAENVLFLMDDIPVYDPYHFYNVFPPFHPGYFTSVQVHKNNMPVEYGGRIDGLIDLEREPNGKSYLLLNADLLQSSLAGNWKINEYMGFAAAGRISYTDILQESLYDTSSFQIKAPGPDRPSNEWSSSQQPEFNFYDINVSSFASFGEHDLKVSYFKSKDYLENNIRTLFETTAFNKDIITVRTSLATRDDWSNEGASMVWDAGLSSNFHLTMRSFISSFDKTSYYSSYFEEMRRANVRSGRREGIQDNELLSYGGMAKAVISTSNTLTIQGGAEMQHHEIDLVAIEKSTPYLLEVQEENEVSVFAAVDQQWTNNLTIQLGSRLTYLSGMAKLYWQPNVQVNVELTDEIQLDAAYSKSIQSARELTIENRFGRETELIALSSTQSGIPILSAHKFMVGASLDDERWLVRSELFYKKTDGIMSVRPLRPELAIDSETSIADFYRFFTGDGWTAGIDVIGYYTKDPWSASVSYTLSKITQRFDQLFNGEYYLPKEDRRHQIKLSSQYQLGKFMLNGLLTYKSKAPYTSFALLEDGGGFQNAQHNTVIRYLPPYFSLDLGVDYSFPLFRHPAIIGVSLINATNHTNISDLQYLGRVNREFPGMNGLFLTSQTELLSRIVNVKAVVLFGARDK